MTNVSKRLELPLFAFALAVFIEAMNALITGMFFTPDSPSTLGSWQFVVFWLLTIQWVFFHWSFYFLDQLHSLLGTEHVAIIAVFLIAYVQTGLVIWLALVAAKALRRRLEQALHSVHLTRLNLSANL